MLPQVSIFTYMCVCVCCVLRIELATWQRRRRSRRRVADTFVVVVVAVFFYTRLRSRPRLVFAGDLFLYPCYGSHELLVDFVT